MLPDYDNLLQNLLDLLVSQSEIILAAAFHEYDSHKQQFIIRAMSIDKSAPRKYRTVSMMIRRSDIRIPAGRGFLRDQVVQDGATRLVLGKSMTKVYRLKGGKLIVNTSSFPPESDAMKASGVDNFLTMSTRVHRSQDDLHHTGFIHLVLPTQFSEIEAEKFIAVFEECQRIINSEDSRRIFEGFRAQSRKDSKEPTSFKASRWKRLKSFSIVMLILLITVPAVWFGVTLGLPLVVKANQNIVAVIVVLAEIAVAIVLWAISGYRRR